MSDNDKKSKRYRIKVTTNSKDPSIPPSQRYEIIQLRDHDDSHVESGSKRSLEDDDTKAESNRSAKQSRTSEHLKRSGDSSDDDSSAGESRIIKQLKAELLRSKFECSIFQAVVW